MDRSLYEAIASEDIGALGQLTSDDLKKETTPLNNNTLHVAVQLNKIRCVKEICRKNPSLLMQQNLKGETPLHIAARLGSSEIVEQLLIGGAKIIHQRDIQTGCEGLSTFTLLQQLVRTRSKENDTALHEAVRYHWLEVAKLLLKADPEFEYSANSAGETPLYLAAEEGLHEYVDEILKTGLASAYKGPRGWTALHVAAMSGNSDIIKLLLDKKPNIIQEADEKGCSALHCAAFFAKVEVVDLLLEADPTVAYILDKDGRTALHIAASSRMPRSIAHMLKKDGTVGWIAREFVSSSSAEKSLSHELEKSGKSITLAANHKFRKQRVEVIEKVSKTWPGCWERLDNNGQNFLHVAAEKGHLHVIQYVLNLRRSKAVDNLIHEKDNHGNTPLHLVLKSGCIECLRVLCKDYRVNKRAINNENLTALDIVLDNLEKAYGSYEDFLWKAYQYLREEGGSVWNDRRPIKEKEERYEAIMDDSDGRVRKQREATEQLSQIQVVVAAAVIGTVTYAAGLQLPGGFDSDGIASLGHLPEFKAFLVMNSVAMILSISTFTQFWFKTGSSERKMRKKIEQTHGRIYIALFLMMFVFEIGSYRVLGSDWLTYTKIMNPILFFISCFNVHWMVKSRIFNPLR